MTSAGIEFSFLFDQFLKLISRKYSKRKTQNMLIETLTRYDLFDDAILETLWLEYRQDILRLAYDTFPGVVDEESFMRKLLYYRPALFDPKHLLISLVNKEETDDIWSMLYSSQ